MNDCTDCKLDYLMDWAQTQQKGMKILAAITGLSPFSAETEKGSKALKTLLVSFDERTKAWTCQHTKAAKAK